MQHFAHHGFEDHSMCAKNNSILSRNTLWWIFFGHLLKCTIKKDHSSQQCRKCWWENKTSVSADHVQRCGSTNRGTCPFTTSLYREIQTNIFRRHCCEIIRAVFTLRLMGLKYFILRVYIVYYFLSYSSSLAIYCHYTTRVSES